MPPDNSALRRARDLMDSTFALVQPDSLYERAIPPRHRIVFYIGHVEAFDRNLLGVPSVDPALDSLFAFGIDPPPGQLPSDPASAWPALPQVYEYRDRVRDAVNAAWNAAPVQLRHVALEHRLMHAETFAYMIHGMDAAKLVRPHEIEHTAGTSPPHEQMDVPAGDAVLGQAAEDEF